MAIPKIEIVTQEKARKQKLKLLIGFQFGILGYIIRAGIYH